MKPYPKMVGENSNLTPLSFTVTVSLKLFFKGKRHNKMGRGFSVQNILHNEKRERAHERRSNPQQWKTISEVLDAMFKKLFLLTF